MPPLLNVDALSAGFLINGKAYTAVDEVSFSLEAGETLVLLGESGSGKSMTALAILDLLPENAARFAGKMSFAGEPFFPAGKRNIKDLRGADIGMIFQEPASSLNPVLRIETQIGEVLFQHTKTKGRAAKTKIEALLNAVGISDAKRRSKHYPFELSGGMKQRVMIAQALAASPKILIADEPTTALDVTLQAQILQLLKELQTTKGMGLLLITHDLGVAAQMADRVIVMYAGQIVEEAASALFFDEKKRKEAHPYTQKLFAALPEKNKKGLPLATIFGQVPSLLEPKEACAFAPRCPFAYPLCFSQIPPVYEKGARKIRCHLKGELKEENSPIAKHAPSEPPAFQSHEHQENAFFRIQHVRVYFPIRASFFSPKKLFLKAVDDVSFSLHQGKTLGLIGESGCGKTSLAKAILQINPIISGDIFLAQKPIAAFSKKAWFQQVQMIFQDPFSSLNPRRTVFEILNEGAEALLDAPLKKDALSQLLHDVGLSEDALFRYPHEFSGGQRQRIAIARALAVSPKILVCDEPTSALDVSVQAQILNLFQKLQKERGIAYLFVTHNLAILPFLADEIAVMYLGKIVEKGSADQIMNAPAHPYTQALMRSSPSVRAAQKLTCLTGEIPSPIHPPKGCAFHPRCQEALPICQESLPIGTHLKQNHWVACHLRTEFLRKALT